MDAKLNEEQGEIKTRMKMKLHHHCSGKWGAFERKTSRLTIETELNLEGEEEIRKRYEAVHGIIHEDNPETE